MCMCHVNLGERNIIHIFPQIFKDAKIYGTDGYIFTSSNIYGNCENIFYGFQWAKWASLILKQKVGSLLIRSLK